MLESSELPEPLRVTSCHATVLDVATATLDGQEASSVDPAGCVMDGALHPSETYLWSGHVGWSFLSTLGVYGLGLRPHRHWDWRSQGAELNLDYCMVRY